MALAAMLWRRGRWIVKVNRDLVLDCNFGERARLVDRAGVAERQGSSSAAATFGLVGRRLSRPCTRRPRCWTCVSSSLGDAPVSRRLCHCQPCAHVSLVPDMHGERKTKPTQTTVHSLRELGLLPDLVRMTDRIGQKSVIMRDPTTHA